MYMFIYKQEPLLASPVVTVSRMPTRLEPNEERDLVAEETAASINTMDGQHKPNN